MVHFGVGCGVGGVGPTVERAVGKGGKGRGLRGDSSGSISVSSSK
jgi:hypothetical protein